MAILTLLTVCSSFAPLRPLRPGVRFLRLTLIVWTCQWSFVYFSRFSHYGQTSASRWHNQSCIPKFDASTKTYKFTFKKWQALYDLINAMSIAFAHHGIAVGEIETYTELIQDALKHALSSFQNSMLDDKNPTNNLARHRIYCMPINFKGVADVLYRNNGDGTFTDVTHEAGRGKSNGKGLGVVWGDYDNDGDPDIFVANDTTPNMLYRNNGDGTFTDMALFAGVIARSPRGLPLSGMGTSFGDYDNDGWLDLIATHFEDDPNTLYRNLADGTFLDVTDSSGVGKKSLPYLAWGVEFGDKDNDGYQDIFVANGHNY